MANNLKVNYYETSALNSEGINEAFEVLTKEIMKKKQMNIQKGGLFHYLLVKRLKKKKKDVVDKYFYFY